MESAQPRVKKAATGAPPWMATFADLMSLLMAFFVLLFSFSEMDRLKFKELAGSMRDAFGVQREVKTREPPKGINVVAREFSAGRPEPTPLNVVQQETDNDLKRHLAVAKTRRNAQASESLKVDAKKIRETLAEEIEQGLVEVETVDSKIVIRIREKSSFGSGRAELEPTFVPVLHKIGAVIGEMSGAVVVAGHTDDLPIQTSRFRSNWELSSARAVTVVHGLLDGGFAQPERITAEGHADTKPVDSNETPEGRTRNRRVEVVLVKGADDLRDANLSALRRTNQ